MSGEGERVGKSIPNIFIKNTFKTISLLIRSDAFYAVQANYVLQTQSKAHHDSNESRRRPDRAYPGGGMNFF